MVQWKRNKHYIVSLCVAVSIQHEMRICHTVNGGLPSSAIFFHILINGTIFKKKTTEHKMHVWFSLKLLSETFLIQRKTEQDMTKICKLVLMLQYPLFLLHFNET